MTYTISKKITIHNDQDGWKYVCTTDEYGTVSVEGDNGFGIHIPRDCVQHFINVLEELK